MEMVNGGFVREPTKDTSEKPQRKSGHCPNCGSRAIDNLGPDRCHCRSCHNHGPNRDFRASPSQNVM